jgi:hypothetical protein
MTGGVSVVRQERAEVCGVVWLPVYDFENGEQRLQVCVVGVFGSRVVNPALTAAAWMHGRHNHPTARHRL